MVVYTGTDIVDVGRITNLKTSIRERFLHRVYTVNELVVCGDNDQRIAGRFACKEAVVKALGTGFGDIAMHDIEILQNEAGAPILFLYGPAQIASDKLGIVSWSVSISHLKEYATAVAVAIG